MWGSFDNENVIIVNDDHVFSCNMKVILSYHINTRIAIDLSVSSFS